MLDLTDEIVRASVAERLAALYAGRPVVVGPTILAGATGIVSWLRELGCPVLVVSTGNTLVAADTATGLFAKIDPCAALVRGQRLATVTAGLLRFVDRELGTDFGALEAAPDLRQ